MERFGSRRLRLPVGTIVAYAALDVVVQPQQRSRDCVCTARNLLVEDTNLSQRSCRMSERIVTTNDGDAAGTAAGASSLISTIVWAIVVLTLLIVGIIVLLHYHIL